MFRPSDSDYSKNIIYKVYCKTDPSQFIIGSTCQLLERRFQKYQFDYKIGKFTEKHKLYMAFNKYGSENFAIEKVKDYPCNNYDEARMEEAKIAKEMGSTLNTNKPYLSHVDKKEYQNSWASIRRRCDCGIKIRNNNYVHKKKLSHLHMMKVKTLIETGKFEEFGEYKYVDAKAIICACYYRCNDKVIFDKHINGPYHKRYMLAISYLKQKCENENKDTKDLVSVNIKPNNEVICECGTELFAGEYNKHVTMFVHKEMMENRNRIKLEMEGKKIEIPDGYRMCIFCYNLCSKSHFAEHFDSERHKLYSKAAIRIKELFQKQKELSNPNLKFVDLYGLVKLEIFSNTPIPIKNESKEKKIVNIFIEPNDKIMCECGDILLKKEYEKHMMLSNHRELLEIKERIKLKMENKEIEIPDEYFICDTCFVIYKLRKRHFKTWKHIHYSSIAFRITELFQRQKELNNPNLKFSDLYDPAKLEIFPINLSVIKEKEKMKQQEVNNLFLQPLSNNATNIFEELGYI